MNSSQMARASWKARIEKYGKEGAINMLRKAGRKSNKKAKRNANGRYEKKAVLFKRK